MVACTFVIWIGKNTYIMIMSCQIFFVLVGKVPQAWDFPNDPLSTVVSTWTCAAHLHVLVKYSENSILNIKGNGYNFYPPPIPFYIQFWFWAFHSFDSNSDFTNSLDSTNMDGGSNSSAAGSLLSPLRKMDFALCKYENTAFNLELMNSTFNFIKSSYSAFR